MIAKLLTKLRAILQDSSQSSLESFTATNSKTFTIAQDNVEEITEITVNGTAIASAVYDYEDSSQTVTIDEGSVAATDVVIIYFDYTKYSDTVLIDYLRAALSFMDVYIYPISFLFFCNDGDIFPIPKVKEQSLIIIIASILIKPNYSEYRTSSILVKTPVKLSKEERIEKLISMFKFSKIGCTGVIELRGENF